VPELSSRVLMTGGMAFAGGMARRRKVAIA
jgi:hypothetical protein